MAGGRDLYGTFGGTPDVAPTETGGGVPFSVRATPDSFGAQMGEAREQKGAAVENTGTAQTELALKQLGMMNETAATNAETDYMIQLGKMEGDLKSKKGVEAINSLPDYLTNVTALRQQVRGTLPGGAARAFDMLASRREGFAIVDAHNYVAGQVKEADYTSAARGIAASVSQAGMPSVATNDAEFNNTLQDIQFHTVRQFQDHPGVTTDPETGKQTFAKTPEGEFAKKDLDQRLSAATGDAYINRFVTLNELHGTVSAYDSYEAQRQQIPPATQVKLDAYFAPKLQEAKARHIAGVGLSMADADYQESVSSPEALAKTRAKGNVTGAIFGQESGDNSNSAISINGAIGPAQIMPDTFKQYAHAGEDINNPADNRTVGKRIIADLSHRFDGDPARIAVGYFSGPNNVAPAGSPTPWKEDRMDGNGKSVSSYVEDVQKRMGTTTSYGAPAGEPQQASPQTQKTMTPPSQADYYRENYSEILSRAQTAADNLHPGDIDFATKTRAYTEQYMNDIIKQQEMMLRVDKDKVLGALNGDASKGEKPTTMEQLEASSPAIKKSLDNVMMHDPRLYDTISKKLLTANSRRDTDTNSDNYLYNLKKIVGGEEVITEGYLHGLLTRSDGTGINLKDYRDLRDALDQSGKMDGWADFLKTNIKSIENANGNIDGQGDKRALAFVDMAQKMRKQGEGQQVPLSDMINPESPSYVGKMMPGLTPSREQQMNGLANSIRGGRITQAPQIGTISKGYEYVGGDPSRQDSWSKVR